MPQDRPGFFSTLIHRANDGVGMSEYCPKTYAALDLIRQKFVDPPPPPEAFSKTFPRMSARIESGREAWIKFLAATEQPEESARMLGAFFDRVVDETDEYMAAVASGGFTYLMDKNATRIREKILTKRVSEQIDFILTPYSATIVKAREGLKSQIKTAFSSAIVLGSLDAAQRIEDWKETWDRRWREKWGIELPEEREAMASHLSMEQREVLCVTLTDRLIDITTQDRERVMELRATAPDDGFDGPEIGSR